MNNTNFTLKNIFKNLFQNNDQNIYARMHKECNGITFLKNAKTFFQNVNSKNVFKTKNVKSLYFATD